MPTALAMVRHQRRLAVPANRFLKRRHRWRGAGQSMRGERCNARSPLTLLGVRPECCCAGVQKIMNPKNHARAIRYRQLALAEAEAKAAVLYKIADEAERDVLCTVDSTNLGYTRRDVQKLSIQS